MISTILAKLPIIEVTYRHLYWRSGFFRYIGQKITSHRKKSAKLNSATNSKQNSLTLDDLISSCKKLGITEGDVLIIHSSTSKLLKAGHKQAAIIEALHSLVGDTGTLVFPTFPLFPESPAKEKRFNSEEFESVFEFDKSRNKIWTGLLPRFFVRLENVYHSSIPLNTLSAKGGKAKEIIFGDADNTIVTPCGKNTPWHRCLNYNAKILMIDLPVAHSLTMIHVNEDLYEKKWPIKKWYRNRKFRIIEKSNTTEINIKERDPKWALYYCENRLNYDLKKDKVFKYETINDELMISVCESQTLINYLSRKSHNAYPYHIPWYIKPFIN